jgi:hypothetical protein
MEAILAHGVCQTEPRAAQARSRRTGFQLLTDNPSERILETRGLTVEVFSKRRVDERLISSAAARCFRHLKESVHYVLIEPDSNADLALGFRFRRKNLAALSFAEVVSVFHRSASYCSRS